MKSKIPQFLKQKNLSVQALSHKLGMARQYTSMLVHGQINPHGVTIDRLCTALECRIEDLFEAEMVDLTKAQKRKVENFRLKVERAIQSGNDGTDI